MGAVIEPRFVDAGAVPGRGTGGFAEGIVGIMS